MKFVIRPAIPADQGAIADLHTESWRQRYRGVLPDAYLDRPHHLENRSGPMAVYLEVGSRRDDCDETGYPGEDPRAAQYAGGHRDFFCRDFFCRDFVCRDFVHRDGAPVACGRYPGSRH